MTRRAHSLRLSPTQSSRGAVREGLLPLFRAPSAGRGRHGTALAVAARQRKECRCPPSPGTQSRLSPSCSHQPSREPTTFSLHPYHPSLRSLLPLRARPSSRCPDRPRPPRPHLQSLQRARRGPPGLAPGQATPAEQPPEQPAPGQAAPSQTADPAGGSGARSAAVWRACQARSCTAPACTRTSRANAGGSVK